MPRIRTIKPQFWDSPGTAKASLRARLFFIAMWNWADDYGVGDANPSRLIGFAFPNDPEISAKDFPTLRKEVSDNFSVVFYEVDGRPYFWIPSWDKHQRTERKAKGLYPLPEAATSLVNTGKSELPTPSEGTSDATQGSSGVGRRKKEEGRRKENNVEDAPRPDTIRLCNLLADLIEGNGSKRPTVTRQWLDQARLMIDKDGRPLGEAIALIQWSQADPFWYSNILSMRTFREKYDQLRLQRARKGATPEPPAAPLRIIRANDAD